MAEQPVGQLQPPLVVDRLLPEELGHGRHVVRLVARGQGSLARRLAARGRQVQMGEKLLETFLGGLRELVFLAVTARLVQPAGRDEKQDWEKHPKYHLTPRNAGS